jgi:aspartokinase
VELLIVTISHIVQKLVDEKVFIQESMEKDIISYASLAKQLQSEIEEELGKKVKKHAIEMALRRYREQLKQKHKKVSFNYSSDIIMKTKICDIAVVRSPTLLVKLRKLYDIIDFERGDILNIIQGSSEVSIVTNERYKNKFLEILNDEKILIQEENLISLTMTFSKNFYYTPGVVFNIIRNVAWENINIYEIVSTNTELTFIIHKKDAMKAYRSLEKLIQT